ADFRLQFGAHGCGQGVGCRQRSGTVRAQASRPFTGPAAFSCDGRLIAFASTNGTVSVFDASSSQQILRLNGHVAAIAWLAFSPDGQWIATASEDQTAMVCAIGWASSIRQMRPALRMKSADEYFSDLWLLSKSTCTLTPRLFAS